MSRSDQWMGLNHRAREFLGLNEKVLLGETRTFHRSAENVIGTDSGWVSMLGTRTKIIRTEPYKGAWNEFSLNTYLLPYGRIFREEIQATPWSSGPMHFVALKDEQNVWVKESLWLNSDPESEGQLTDTTDAYFPHIFKPHYPDPTSLPLLGDQWCIICHNTKNHKFHLPEDLR